MDSDGHPLALQFAAVERTLVATTEDAEGQPFDVRVERFLIAASSELGRISAAQLATGRGDAMLRQYVEQRVDAVVCRRLYELLPGRAPAGTAAGAA
ncbi:hypothetical protein [Streptomyces sp. NPDC048496]|uniref:hypothetical protein n=1 Tax=Streptomyces sp. NPDC048496 TaxID=3365558 RepID=UPI0037151328